MTSFDWGSHYSLVPGGGQEVSLRIGRLLMAHPVPPVMRKSQRREDQETKFGEHMAIAGSHWLELVYCWLAFPYASTTKQVCPGPGRDLESFPSTSCWFLGLAGS